jgi:hypothetical protein
MFPFRIAEPNQTGQLTRWDIPINRWLDVKQDEGLHDRAGAALARLGEDIFSGGPEISAEEANSRYALEGLKFDSPINEERARLMHERKRMELRNLAYMESAAHSWFSAKAAAGLGTSMLSSLLHPVDFATIFVPVVGVEAKAAGIAKLGGGALRQRLARGLITEEALAASTRFPKFNAAFIEGTVGNAIAEIPLLIQNMRDQAVYGPEDSAINILAGGLFAAGIRVSLEGLGRAMEAAAFVHRSLDPQTREAMFLKGIDDYAKGRDIKVDDYVKVDDNVIRSKVVFDEAGARQKAETEVGQPLEPEVWHVTVQSAQEYDKMLVPGYVQLDEVRNGQNLRSVSAEALRKEGRYVDDFSQLPQGRYTLKEAQALLDNMNAERGLPAAREQAIREAVEKKRKDHEANKESLVEAERQAEIQRQIAAGKILPDEEIERIQLKGEAMDSNDAAIVAEDTKSIEQELDADMQRRLNDLTPEEKETLQAELDEELGQVNEKVYKPRQKAIEAAIPCVIQGAMNG